MRRSVRAHSPGGFIHMRWFPNFRSHPNKSKTKQPHQPRHGAMCPTPMYSIPMQLWNKQDTCCHNSPCMLWIVSASDHSVYGRGGIIPSGYSRLLNTWCCGRKRKTSKGEKWYNLQNTMKSVIHRSSNWSHVNEKRDQIQRRTFYLHSLVCITKCKHHGKRPFA